MGGDSKEKIISDYNNLLGNHGPWAPFGASARIRLPDSLAKEPITDFEEVYRKLKGYARGHGKPERRLNADKLKLDFGVRQEVSQFMGLWARAKALKKAQKRVEMG